MNVNVLFLDIGVFVFGGFILKLANRALLVEDVKEPNLLVSKCNMSQILILGWVL